ncbi:MAG TPA: redoxin domain-containing protein [Planctomycetaceae bacterium]|jgi:thiol-disulfide isomerase/thioredoxin/mono/diheme cytochrome c family protein|nr:redoxin domain-containing protein [Planctomycetaceae bacterium]
MITTRLTASGFERLLLAAAALFCPFLLGDGQTPSFAADKAPGRPAIANFTLSDIHAQKWSLDTQNDKQTVVVAFVGTECPLAKLYAPRLAQLAASYAGKSVAFVAIDSNVQDSLAELLAYARNAKIDFPVLRDVKNEVAAQFGAVRNPQVFVLDRQRVVRYRGRIDDQYGVGFARTEPKQNDLKQAVDELLAGKDVTVSETPAVGCLIGRPREPQAAARVTYSNQIARLFNKRCVECHHAGDIAPFSLTNYEEASGWAEMIAEVIDQGRMPPWHADPKVGKFSDDRRLTDEERHEIHEWVAAGAPQGDPKQLPPAPSIPSNGWHHDQPPDLILAMSKTPYRVKADGVLRYQNFRVETGFTSDKWVEMAEVMPGNRAVVHHVLVHCRSPHGRGGGALAGQGFLVAYVPGLRPIAYPKGMAKRIPAGSVLTFQIHYTPNGSVQDDITRIGLWFADPKKVTHEVTTIAAANPLFVIPPGNENYAVEATSNRLPNGAQVLTFMPHMHLRGKSFFYEAVFANGKRQTLLDVPKYDFNWQTSYREEQPLKFPAGTRIHAIAHFDNSEENLNNPNPKAPVTWGDQTYEEMMIGYFDMAVPKRDHPDSGRGLHEDRSGRGGMPFTGLSEDALRKTLKKLDANKDGKISRDEVPEWLRDQFDRISGGKDISVDEAQKRLVRLLRRTDRS